MKKAISILISAIMLICVLSPFSAVAQTVKAPALKSISFNNAELEQKFSSNTFEYTVKLKDTQKTPTLKAYKVSGSASVFVNYLFDDAKHQNGIAVTLEYSNGSVIYNFKYSNAQFNNSTNNLLESVSCELGEVYPAINEKDTDYKLYIPMDLTEVTLSAVTEETGAYAEVPGTLKAKAGQKLPTISINVTAGNGDIRTYNFKIKRIKKTCDEVKAEMQSPDFKSIIDDVLFYKQPEFVVIISSIAGGLVILLILILIAKKLTIKVGDDDEGQFFSTPDEENSQEEEYE